MDDDEIVFDKAKWHYEGKFPKDLDEEQGFVHTGMFLGWIIEAGLYSEDFADDFKSEIRKFKARKLTGTGVYSPVLASTHRLMASLTRKCSTSKAWHSRRRITIWRPESISRTTTRY